MKSNDLGSRELPVMARSCSSRLGLLCLFAGMIVAVASSTVVNAQSFTSIYSFQAPTNNTGTRPVAQLVQGPDGTLYGTTLWGQGNAKGTVFKLRPDGSGFAVLKYFTNQMEGLTPMSALTVNGNSLYGISSYGGASNLGTIFRVNTDGTGYTVLKSFTGADGAMAWGADWFIPSGPMVLLGNTLYGTTVTGGSFGHGTVFRIELNGTGYAVLKSFSESEGKWPLGALVTDGTTLYGTTCWGGAFGYGTVFKINTGGGGYSILRSFEFSEWSGRNPVGGMVLKENILYGTTVDPGTEQDWYNDGYLGAGTIFRINTDGTAFVILKKFNDADGLFPLGGLALSGSELYGTTYAGGASQGAVFKMNTDGGGYRVLARFGEPYVDGANPVAGLLLSGQALFGTTEGGLPSGSGTLFKMNTDGSGFSHLLSFGPLAPENPSSVALSGNTLYGTTRGFYWNGGSIYKISTNGTSFTELKRFIREGQTPLAGVEVDGTDIYGATYGGPTTNSTGTLFKLKTDGSGFTVLKDFVHGEGNAKFPTGPPLLVGNMLYGTTTQGGSQGKGTVYKAGTDGSGYTILKNLGGSNGSYPYWGLARDGTTLYGITGDALFKLDMSGSDFGVVARPPAGDGWFSRTPLIRGNVLYGITQIQLSTVGPKVFRVGTDGSDYKVLKSFEGSETMSVSISELVAYGDRIYGTAVGGAFPNGGLVFSLKTDGTDYTIIKGFGGPEGNEPVMLDANGATLYGVTSWGGDSNRGTIFKVDLTSIVPPLLSIQRIGNQAVISWGEGPFNLQSSTSLNSGFSTIMGATSPFTNLMNSPQRYFRLSQ